RGGKTASAALTVVVNAPPVLAITSPADGFDSVPGAAVIFTASASDTEDGSLDAAIRWSSSLDGALGPGPTLRVSTLRSGTHAVTAAVTDSGGRTASRQVTVVVNAPPTLVIASPPDGAMFLPGDAVALEATASDVEDGDLGSAVRWASSLDGPLGTGGVLSVGTLRSGTHLITARVTDSGGKAAEAGVTVVVNAAPTVTITGPADGSTFSPGDAISLTGKAGDAEDGDLGAAIVWSSSLDGPLGTGSAIGVPTLRSGTHTITASVTDRGGTRALATITLVVNAAPSVGKIGRASCRERVWVPGVGGMSRENNSG